MKTHSFIIYALLLLLLTACGGSGQSPRDTDYPPSQESEAPTPRSLPGFRGLNNASPGFVTDFDFGASDFPAVHITTEHYEIDRYVRIAGTLSISNTAASLSLPETPMRIRGRGNSSWDDMDKKPFRIRFDEPVELLNAGHAAYEWTFISNHSDKSLLRNYSAYFMAGLMDGMDYVPFAHIVDVYFNGEYQGVYMVSVQLNEICEGRVNLTYSADPGRSEFLIELNRRIVEDPDAVEGLHYLEMHGHGRFYEIRWPTPNTPHPDALTAAHVDELRDFLNLVDEMLARGDAAVFRYICMDSFVDYYLVQEIYKNYDISSLSVFMQLRGEGANRRLEKGPVWDFDISAGNCYYQDRDNNRGGYGPTGIWAGYMNRWFRLLLEMPDFRAAVAERLAWMREHALPQTLALIEDMAAQYQSSFERNFVRWPIMGLYIWPNPREVKEIDTFIGQVEYLTEFLTARVAWLGDYFGL